MSQRSVSTKEQLIASSHRPSSFNAFDMPISREYNSEAERDAAARRAKVAAAVNKQEWLDKTEVSFGAHQGVGSRVANDPSMAGPGGAPGDYPGDAEEEDKYFDEDPLLKMMPPPQEPDFVQKAKSLSWVWGVALFALFLVGAVLLFWDDMHVHKVSGRPDAAGAADENIKEEAEDFGTTVTELAVEIQDEAQEASQAREAEAADLKAGGDGAVAEDVSEGDAAAEVAEGEGDARRHRRRLLFAERPARRFLVAPAL